MQKLAHRTALWLWMAAVALLCGLALPQPLPAQDKAQEPKKAKAVKEVTKRAKPAGKLTPDEMRAMIPVSDAQAPPSTELSATKAVPVMPEEVEKKPKKGKQRPPAIATVSKVRFYGHAFVYLTSSTGVRIAFDPFGPNVVQYPFPIRLPADLVLISSLADDREGGERLFGDPPVYRANVSIGRIRANGLDLKGVQSFCDVGRSMTNTIYVLKMDGMTFVHVGNLGQVLDARQREEIGSADVLFLNVGTLQLTVEQLNRIALDMGAKIIIPLACKTPKSGPLMLRAEKDFTGGKVFPVQTLGTSEITLSQSTLPPVPTIYVMKAHEAGAPDADSAPEKKAPESTPAPAATDKPAEKPPELPGDPGTTAPTTTPPAEPPPITPPGG
ncbi:MAG: MBL fold metallo-hydrolase [Candidatus Methylacidiphilales bacterium]